MGDVTSEWLAFRALEFTNKISKEHRLSLTQHAPNWDAIEKVYTFDLFGVNRDMIKIIHICLCLSMLGCVSKTSTSS